MIDDTATPRNPDELLTPFDIEDEYKIPYATQAKYRGEGSFCAYLKIGRRVYVRRSTFEKWLDTKVTYSTTGRPNAR